MEVGRIEGGCRVLLCVDGGIVTGEVLGSRSAHLATDIGGSALRAGEELAMGRPLRGVQVGGLSADLLQRITSRLSRRLLRQVPGAQHERFEDDARRMMVEREFTISDRSDRTGVRLDGAVIEAPGGSMRSEGVVTGAVQVPPDGKPIALLTDRPATGGYPVIGCIIGADLAALGQLRPRERVRFEWVERAWAVEDLRELEAMIASVPMPRPSGHARSHG